MESPYAIALIAIERYNNDLITLRELIEKVAPLEKMLAATDAIDELDADGLEYLAAYIGDAKSLMAEKLFANSVPAFD